VVGRGYLALETQKGGVWDLWMKGGIPSNLKCDEFLDCSSIYLMLYLDT